MPPSGAWKTGSTAAPASLCPSPESGAESADVVPEDFLPADFLLADLSLADFLLADFLLADFLLADFSLADFLLADFVLAVFVVAFVAVVASVELAAVPSAGTPASPDADVADVFLLVDFVPAFALALVAGFSAGWSVGDAAVALAARVRAGFAAVSGASASTTACVPFVARELRRRGAVGWSSGPDDPPASPEV